VRAAGAMRAGERVRVTGMQGLVLTVVPGTTKTSGG
jgi:membrane protein implicated in regulation of membrane protease activity